MLVAKIGIPSFMATLGTQFFWAGMATVLSGGKSYALRGAEEQLGLAMDRRAPVRRSASTTWLQQLSIQALWTALIVAFLWFILTRHRFGEHALFIGDSNDVSRVVGIDVDREKIKLFTLMGFLAACAAIILTLENKNFFGNQGQGYLLTAIASVLIGGTSIFGGQATIVGTVFGCFIIGMVEAGLVASGLTGAWVQDGAGPHLPGLDHLLHVCGRTAAPARALRQSAVVPEIRPHASRPKRDAGFADSGGPQHEGRKRTCVWHNCFWPASAAAAAGDCRGSASAADPIGKGLVMYMQMGGNAGDGATLARQTGAKEAADGARRRPQGAVLGLGARDDDQPVQGGDRRQAELHRDHGPPRRRPPSTTSSSRPSIRASSSPPAIRR